MTKEQKSKEDWKIEFDKFWKDKYAELRDDPNSTAIPPISNWMWYADPTEVKSFISSQKQKSYKEGYEEGNADRGKMESRTKGLLIDDIKKARQTLFEELVKEIEGMKKLKTHEIDIENEICFCYKEALEAVIKKLKEKL